MPAVRLLVTGARGFLGSHVVARARERELDVIAAYRGAIANDIMLDVCDPASIDAALSSTRPSIVIHCAAYGVNYADQNFASAFGVNVRGTLELLKAAAHHGVQRFVQIGSCFEYGSKPGPIRETESLAPTAVYGATKAAATLLGIELARSVGISFVVARPFGMWGPGEPPHRIVPQVIDACMNRLPLKLTHCDVVRDYTYVEDMAANVLALALRPNVSTGTIVNLGTGRPTVLREFILSIVRLLDGEELMQFGVLPHRTTEMPSLVADVSRMRELLGPWTETSLEDGMRRMIASLTPSTCDGPTTASNGPIGQG